VAHAFPLWYFAKHLPLSAGLALTDHFGFGFGHDTQGQSSAGL